MKALKVVSLVLCISNVFSTAIAKDAWAILPHFSCGKYLFKGNLKLSKKGDSILQVRIKTTSPYELLLVGLPAEELLKNEGTTQVVEVEILKPIIDHRESYVFFKKFQPPSI